MTKEQTLIREAARLALRAFGSLAPAPYMPADYARAAAFAAGFRDERLARRIVAATLATRRV